MSKGEDGYVFIKKTDLAHLATEITQLKQNLPSLLTKQLTTAQLQIQVLEKENLQLKDQCQHLTSTSTQWKSRYDAAISDIQIEKQECLRAQHDVKLLTEQLTQQSDYCSSLGSACCSLLWWVSRQEECIQAILAGTKMDEFLSLVSSTLHSYVSAYKDDWPQEQTDETQFVLALCGIVTNIAASAYGREFLCANSNGKAVIDTYIEVLPEAPTCKSARLKNLLVTCLYNLTLNQKGMKYLEGNSGVISLCAWLIQVETDGELRANCLRLVQPLMYEYCNVSTLHQLQEVLPDTVLVQLSKDVNSEVRELALEMISDLQHARHPSES